MSPFQLTNGDKRDMSRNIDADTQYKPRVVSIIILFNDWRRMDGLSYKVHSFLVCHFVFKDSYAQM